MYEAFIDLDELILRCRDKLSRKFIQEAVSCYRAGAFRSCIVATWNAVVFDFLHKLRELELLGDKEAANLLKEFDKLRGSGKQFRELWKFESDIPEIALTKFELISTVEKSDIERLFEDRSRCAHPSMTSLEEPFEATAELARYHLRSAVTHLLERPPVQGRAASERIFQDIKSEYFPVEPESAIKYFQKSPLARARFALVKDIVIGLTKSLLIEERPEDERARQFSALNAISNMYPQEIREILNAQLSDIILNRVMDENWDKAIVYLGSITAWDSLSEPCRLKAEAYIDKIDIFETHQKNSKQLSQEAVFILVKASRIGFLRESIIKKLHISLKDLLSLRETCKDNFFKEKILIPVLRELSSQATLDELLLMRTETLLKSDENIQAYTKEKIKASPLKELTSIASKYQDNWLIDLIESELKVKIPNANLKDLRAAKSRYKSINEPKVELFELFDKFIVKQVKVENISLEKTFELMYELMEYDEDKVLNDLIELELDEKISTASLEDLLAGKSTYKSIDKPKDNILKLLDNSIARQVKAASFDDLLAQRSRWDEISDELIETILKNNVSTIIDKFANSENFSDAGSNSRLLVKIAAYLSPRQWQNILDAFFQNNQIYDSYSCYSGFESLFKKSLELSNCVQPYWLTFREKLNNFNDKHSNSLKRLIDSH
ncbi:hypothetical protein ACE1CD_33105 [Aerosakkonema sp. BLCC-F183]|uniref:hypothetical protein n=1 Tax=Aerosakkonema sp. BLCC-F183 TaxID=3342834 RepID=UPI0035B82D3B